MNGCGYIAIESYENLSIYFYDRSKFKKGFDYISNLFDEKKIIFNLIVISH